MRMKQGINLPLAEQCKILEEIIKKNQVLYNVIMKIEELRIPNCYIGGGCITQTVWNFLYQRDLNYGIGDIDIVYFDEDVSEEKEARIAGEIKTLFKASPHIIDVKNEARVHLWYESRFGFKIEPYKSTEEAISTWPTLATAIGVRYEKKQFVIFAPYGLNDIFAGIIRPNKILITEGVFQAKAKKWQEKWPETKVIPW